jgi:hypothetical protein
MFSCCRRSEKFSEHNFVFICKFRAIFTLKCENIGWFLLCTCIPVKILFSYVLKFLCVWEENLCLNLSENITQHPQTRKISTRILIKKSYKVVILASRTYVAMFLRRRLKNELQNFFFVFSQKGGKMLWI